MKYPTCNFALRSVQEVSNKISDRLTSGNPFSLIRLGDGEGLLLSVSDQSTEADFKYLARHLGTKGVNLDVLLRLKDRLIDSIIDADFIGVRDDIVNVVFELEDFSSSRDSFLENFRKDFRLREVEKSLGYLPARRIAFLHKKLRELNFKENSQFCSAWFHYDYHNAGEVFKVLATQERVGLISCRHRLPSLLEGLFGFSVNFHQIPDMFQDIAPEKITPDYLRQLEDILSRQLVEFPGMLYLVGGGLFGKLYCQLIKSQGGIALDLGSLFDAWLGVPSRPLVYRSMYGARTNDAGVPSRLLLTVDNIDYLSKNESR